MSYRVSKVKGTNTYNIVEKSSELVVQTMDDEKEARKLCRSLNLGAGFNGFTPTFFTIRLEIA